MAALCPGVQYGLSSQESFGENKELIFVKLTDSALRAIEEYLRNKNKFNNSSPTIQFIGNEGQLALPSGGSTSSFSFSMSSTHDMEGPGGSFECVRQTGPPRGPLEALGTIPYKIRVHANDDVYAATRQRMTVAEENHKNKCTLEIKPNQTDIGRKVKVKQTANNGVRGPSISQSMAPREKPQQSHPSMRDSLLKSSPYPSSMNVPSSNKPPPTSQQQPPSHSVHSTTTPVVTSGLATTTPNINGAHHLSNGLGSNHVSSSRPQNKPTTPDILKRPIKERLIHLLALRPFKKYEIFDRLTKEGVREKGSMSSVLKQIAFLKDNAYHLNRACWHDVRENWPFYTESEKQILKRRKPQNLTPPGSSDGGSSSCSGQSPTSTHPGSPPPSLPPPSSHVTTTVKRPGYYDGADGFPTKRQRVSHYRKPEPAPAKPPPPPENRTQRRPVTDSRDTSNMNPRSRESPSTTTLTPPVTNFSSSNNKRGRLSEDEDYDVSSKKRIATTVNAPVNVRPCDSYGTAFDGIIKDYTNGYETKRSNLDSKNNMSPPRNATNGIARVSPDSQSEPERNRATYPDYLTDYTPIKSYEQRKRYKSDFNDNYAEYKDLHGIVEKVSRRFAELEERLKQEDTKSPRYKDIKKQIVREYKENKKNLDHQKAKQRFQYLHDKLSHIKQLVKEYDKSLVNQEDDEDYNRY